MTGRESDINARGCQIECVSCVCLKLSVFEKSFICAERQTDRQTDEFPQPYSENKPATREEP